MPAAQATLVRAAQRHTRPCPSPARTALEGHHDDLCQQKTNSGRQGRHGPPLFWPPSRATLSSERYSLTTACEHVQLPRAASRSQSLLGCQLRQHHGAIAASRLRAAQTERGLPVEDTGSLRRVRKSGRNPWPFRACYPSCSFNRIGSSLDNVAIIVLGIDLKVRPLLREAKR